MEKKCCLLFFLIVSNLFFGQRIKLTYDDAGNQIDRVICFGCAAKNVEQFDNNNLETINKKDFITDNGISYYPNPVKEELYLAWKNEALDFINNIEIYNMNGQLIKTYPNLKMVETTTLNFQTYTEGFYNLILNYESGEKKALKILKK